jgi:hypothetical protein
MTGPQNYQAAERLAQKAEAYLNDGDNEGAAVWAQDSPYETALSSSCRSPGG